MAQRNEQFPKHTKRKNAIEQAYQEKLIPTAFQNKFVTVFFEEPLCKQLGNQTVIIHFPQSTFAEYRYCLVNTARTQSRIFL